MLLTLKPPSNHAFKSFHDYSPPTPPSTSRFSPALISSGPAYPPPARNTTPPSMATPHRGLPLPAALAPPPPSQPSQPAQSQPAAQVPSQPVTQPLGQLPAPPQQWHGAEDSMRTWLQAKAEEDKRRQEEEKTTQESLRLEQRRIEHDILRTSLSGGIPPHLIPLVFAGMGGGSLPSAGLEWAQRYVAQEQQLPQQQQQIVNPLAAAQPSSPMLRREDRQISHPYAASHAVPAPVPSTPISSVQQPSFVQGQGYPTSPRSRTQLPGPSALARTPQSGGLPRLNTGEVQILQSQPAAPQPPSQPTQPSEPSPQQSPGIYFHHWQPPTSQAPASSTQPPTPSDPTHVSSPKKRKAQGPPAAGQQHHSPPFSQSGPSRRRAHSHRSGSLDQARRGRPHEGEGQPRSPEGYGYVEAEQGGRRNTLHSELRHSLPMPPQQQQQRGTEWRYEERTPEREGRRREGRE